MNAEIAHYEWGQSIVACASLSDHPLELMGRQVHVAVTTAFIRCIVGVDLAWRKQEQASRRGKVGRSAVFRVPASAGDRTNQILVMPVPGMGMSYAYSVMYLYRLIPAGIPDAD